MPSVGKLLRHFLARCVSRRTRKGQRRRAAYRVVPVRPRQTDQAVRESRTRKAAPAARVARSLAKFVQRRFNHGPELHLEASAGWATHEGISGHITCDDGRIYANAQEGEYSTREYGGASRVQASTGGESSGSGSSNQQVMILVAGDDPRQLCWTSAEPLQYTVPVPCAQ